jgi:hypothetical protein
MYAPKPAVRGNGHAAIIRTRKADTHLMETRPFDAHRKAAVEKLAAKNKSTQH